MNINDFIDRYSISAIINNIEVLCRTTNDINMANVTYDEYYKHITEVYDKDNYHIIITITDYELGTHIKKFDSIEDRT